MPRVMNHHYILLMHLSWRESFCISYYRDHKKWPEIDYSRLNPQSYLYSCTSTNSKCIPTHPLYNFDEWEYIKFRKTFNVPDKFELSEMIADKSMSHGLTKLKLHIEKNGTIGPSYTRSVILQWLSHNWNDPLEFLEKN